MPDKPEKKRSPAICPCGATEPLYEDYEAPEGYCSLECQAEHEAEHEGAA